MIQTLSLSTIVRAWRDLLAANATISDYCLARYGRTPRLYVGINAKKPPTEADCPYIVIRPGVKEEGELEEFTYAISVGWAIKNENQTTNDNVIEQNGVYECDDLGQLIYQALAEASANSPVTRSQYEIEPIEFWPQFVGQMELETTITPAIGGSITY